MKEAIIMMGLPLAGKSSWIEANNTEAWRVISADQLKESHKDYNPEKAHELHEWSVKEAEQQVYSAASVNTNLIFDSGSINRNYTVRIIEHLQEQDYWIKLVHVKTPVEVCIDRMKARERKVPVEDMIDKSYYEMPQFYRLCEMGSDRDWETINTHFNWRLHVY